MYMTTATDTITLTKDDVLQIFIKWEQLYRDG